MIAVFAPQPLKPRAAGRMKALQLGALTALAEPCGAFSAVMSGRKQLLALDLAVLPA